MHSTQIVNRMVEKWLIVCDDSGHHRAISAIWIEANGLGWIEANGLGSSRVVGEAKSYLSACTLCSKLNEISDVMES